MKPNKVLLTDEEYAEENGARCPWCGSAKIKQIGQFNMGDATQSMRCRECLSSWTDLFSIELKGYSDLTLVDGTQLGDGQ